MVRKISHKQEVKQLETLSKRRIEKQTRRKTIGTLNLEMKKEKEDQNPISKFINKVQKRNETRAREETIGCQNPPTSKNKDVST